MTGDRDLSMALGSKQSSALLPVSQQVSKTLWSSSESRVSVPEEAGETLKTRLRVTGSLFLINVLQDMVEGWDFGVDKINKRM